MKNLVLSNRIKAFLLAGIVSAGVATFTGCTHGGEKEEESSYSVVMNSNKFDDLLKNLPEGIKKENLNLVYNTLVNLNGQVANSVKKDTDGDELFQMNWDTIQALVLASNDFTSQEMVDMFDTFEYDADYLYELYKNFSSIFIPFGERITSSTGLAELIKDEKQKGDFLKYENILIDINIARENNDSEKEESLYKTAFGYIRSDFLSNRGGSAFANEVKENNDATGYSALQVAYVNTILELGRNSEFKLSDNEVKELNSNGICNTALASIEDNLEGYRIKVNALSEEEVKEVSGIYEKARDLGITSLIEESLYFISWENSTLDIALDEEIIFNPIETTDKYASNQPSKNNNTRKETTTRIYNNLDDLKKNENKDVVRQAEQGKKEVDKEIQKENEKNKQQAIQEAESKAQDLSNKNKDESDKKMEGIKEGATIKGSDGNSNNDKEIVQPTKPNEVISGIEEDREFDGPMYDANGNIVSQEKGKVLVK